MGGTPMDSAKVRCSDCHRKCAKSPWYVVSGIRIARNHLVKFTNIFQTNWWFVGKEPLSYPRLGLASVSDLQLFFSGGPSIITRPLLKVFYLLGNFCLGERITLYSRSPTNSTDSIQAVELVLPFGRKHQVQRGFLKSLN